MNTDGLHRCAFSFMLLFVWFAFLLLVQKVYRINKQHAVFVKKEAVVAAETVFYLLHLIVGEGADGEKPEFFFNAFGGIEVYKIMNDFPELFFGGIAAEYLFVLAMGGCKCAHVLMF